MNATASWSTAVICRFRKPDTEAGAALIIGHPELAKDLTPRQPALCHPSPFSKLTAPPDEPSVPIPCGLKRTSGPPREILRRLRMTAFEAPFLLAYPVGKLVGNGKRGLLLQDAVAIGEPQRIFNALVPNLQIGNASVCESLIRAVSVVGQALRVSERSFTRDELMRRLLRLSAKNGSRIGDSQTSAFPIRDWERARAIGSSCLNLTAVKRCSRLHCGWAVGPERRQAMLGGLPNNTRNGKAVGQ